MQKTIKGEITFQKLGASAFRLTVKPVFGDSFVQDFDTHERASELLTTVFTSQPTAVKLPEPFKHDPWINECAIVIRSALGSPHHEAYRRGITELLTAFFASSVSDVATEDRAAFMARLKTLFA